jgi:hypothetical protein
MTTKEKQIYNKAIEACKLFDEFHLKCFTGHPVAFVSNGKLIDHALFNNAYDLAFEVLHELKENEKYEKHVQKVFKVFDNIKLKINNKD